MSSSLKAALAAYGRGLLASVSTVVLFVMVDPDYDLNVLFTLDGIKALGVAALGAALKFTYDYVRVSNSDFGRGSLSSFPEQGSTPEPSYNGPNADVDPPQLHSQEEIEFEGEL